MKKLFYTLVMVCTCFQIQAQNQEIDSLHRPRNYNIKVDQFRGYPDSREDIIFLGNSITAGVYWDELLESEQAKNRGISGDTTFGILERLDEVTEGQPSKIFILIGINDIARNYPDSLIVQNHKKIIGRIKKESPETEIYLQTILPVNNTFDRYPNHYNKDEHIQEVNRELKKIASQEKINLIDLHPHFLDQKGRLDEKFTEEGLHLNAAAYRHWKNILKPYLGSK